MDTLIETIKFYISLHSCNFKAVVLDQRTKTKTKLNKKEEKIWENVRKLKTKFLVRMTPPFLIDICDKCHLNTYRLKQITSH